MCTPSEYVSEEASLVRSCASDSRSQGSHARACKRQIFAQVNGLCVHEVRANKNEFARAHAEVRENKNEWFEATKKRLHARISRWRKKSKVLVLEPLHVHATSFFYCFEPLHVPATSFFLLLNFFARTYLCSMCLVPLPVPATSFLLLNFFAGTSACACTCSASEREQCKTPFFSAKWSVHLLHLLHLCTCIDFTRFVL